MDSDTIIAAEALPAGVAHPFSKIWMVDFEFVADIGEQQRPICMVAEEFWTGRQIRLWEDELAALEAAPFDTGPKSVMVAYFASAELACFLALGWLLPENVLDLFAEHRVITNGTRLIHGNGLLGAARRYGINTIGADEKETMRELVMSGGPWAHDEKLAILDYCASDVELLRPLLQAMAPDIATPQRLGHASSDRLQSPPTQLLPVSISLRLVRTTAIFAAL